MIAIDEAGDADAAEWDRFVASQPDATGYHEWGWRGVFARAFGHESIYLIARDGGRVCGVLPLVYIQSLIFGRSLTSLPFLNYGGVLADGTAVAQQLVDAAAGVATVRRCGHIELRHGARQFPSLHCKQHKVTMTLQLHPEMWAGLDKKVRNQIRKAQKSGLTTAHGGIELVDDFYHVFARNMRDLGTLVYARGFFEEVLRTFPDRTKVHVVRLHGAPVASGITFATRTTTEVPWASSIRDFNVLCPNHLLYWGIIEAAIAARHELLDFGRSTPHEGTYKFKEQWGAAPRLLHWEYWLAKGLSMPNASPTNPKLQLAVRVWKKMPLAVATWIGPSIVRTIP